MLEDPQLCIQRSFLATLNASVDELNGVVLQRLSGIAGNNILMPTLTQSLTYIETYFSQDSIKEGSTQPLNLHGDVLLDYLAMLNEPGIPPYKLKLKVGAICTIQRNLSTEKRLVKNARVIIRELNWYSIKVAVLPQPQAINQDM